VGNPACYVMPSFIAFGLLVFFFFIVRDTVNDFVMKDLEFRNSLAITG